MVREDHVPEFFYYVLRNMKPALEAAANGSTFREISGTALRGVMVPVPPADEQARIAAVLGALDEKMDSNRRLIEVMDELVSCEFSHRLTDARFRNGEVSGWPTACLGDLGRVGGGGTPKTSVPSYWADDGIVWLTPTDMSRLSAPVIRDSARKITEAGLANSSARLLPEGSVHYTSRATLGLTAIATTAVATNQGFISVEPAPEFSSEFVLLLLRARARAIAAHANGSTFLEVNKTNFKRVHFLLPPKVERIAFDAVARPIFEYIDGLDREIGALAALLASLGPRLISGRLRLA